MNSQDLKTKFKNIIDKAVDFVITYKRYFLAGVIFILMAVVLFVGTGSGEGKSTSGVYKSFKKNTNSELTTLITNYYTAYADGDTDTLATLATPVSDQEISYIAFYSQYIDSFDDVEIYTKPGLTENSYLVTTSVQLKYTDIDTAAPGMDFFYVETNEDGNLFINNIYGSFNQNNNVYEMDSEISDLIAVYIRQQDFLDLKAEIDEAYDTALGEDTTLSSFMTESLPAAIIQWNTDYAAQVEAEAEEAAKAEEEAAAAAEAEAQAAADAEEEANSYTGTTNAKANVRSEASKDSDKLGSLESGVEITIYGEEGDFYKFDYNGTKAYITKDAVTVSSEDEEETTEETEEDTTEETTTNTASLTAGDKITLTSTVNIRSGMDSSSSKVAVAYAGESVEVVMSYAEGWTKVKYGKKEGYIRTDLLQE